MQFSGHRIGLLLFVSFFVSMLQTGTAQVNAVTFGKNRMQYKKFEWKLYQSPNFNTYFNQGGLELGKFVTQIAEEELGGIEEQVEYSLQRRGNIVVYNSYDDYKSTNIGLGTDWQSSGGVTKLVNNKIIVYFDGNHQNLRRQIRQGIAKILTENILFGDDLGEIASNQALLDLPKWLTEGYIYYVAERWSVERDDALKNAMLGETYKNFYQFAFEKPELAGHAFWWYIDEVYKRENVGYFLYLARLYKNLNSASYKICKKKFKDVLKEFMEYQNTKYTEDIKKRKNTPKGKLSIVEDITKKDFFRFQANPNPKSNDYAYVEFNKGVYSAKLVLNYEDPKTLISYGVRTRQGDINPNYPILAWDNKGTRLLVLYWKQGAINMFVYDVVAKIKRFKQVITDVDQVLDASFMLNANTLLLSATKNGHSDIYTYDIERNKLTQMTNDVYDDLNPSFVSFPNRSGILFSSNRPGSNAVNADTVLPSRYNFNVFLIDNFNKSDLKQVSQLTNLTYGNARFPMQYNNNHFTFVADENGIANRWAGFFSTARNGVDTLYYIGEELLRNPSAKEFDSTLAAWNKQEPDSISFFQVFKDSTYTFPITNYATNLIETRIAGDKGLVTETRQEGTDKYLYKLRVDSSTLRKRNINAVPSNYMRKVIQQARASSFDNNNGGTDRMGNPYAPLPQADKIKANIFQNGFEDDPADSVTNNLPRSGGLVQVKPNTLQQSKLFNYRLKFSTDFVLAGITNNILINRYQPYARGAGPIQLNNGNDLNWSFRVGVSDLMEDIKFIGGYRLGFNSLRDKDVFLSFQNVRRKIDWGVTYYRSNITNFQNFFTGVNARYGNNMITSLYQLNATLPLNEVKSFRATVAYRTDRGVIRPFNIFNGDPDRAGLGIPDSVASSIVTRFEYVHDNTINKALNIWNGLRYKVYIDMNMPTGKGSSLRGKQTYNIGFDVRKYIPIYRNFIWAGRAAGDFSFGDAKILYYLGGVDGWINPRFNNAPPPTDVTVAFQSLAINMRGYNQNLERGNNAVVFNSEFRLPVFSTLFNRPVNNAFLRNLQLVQFTDLGTAWLGGIGNISRPSQTFGQLSSTNPLTVNIRAGGIGPFAGGYGFGARSTLLGYFLKFDVSWPMSGFFSGKPVSYFAMGIDF